MDLFQNTLLYLFFACVVVICFIAGGIWSITRRYRRHERLLEYVKVLVNDQKLTVQVRERAVEFKICGVECPECGNRVTLEDAYRHFWREHGTTEDDWLL